jgi:flavin-dependent dehydrogenase
VRGTINYFDVAVVGAGPSGAVTALCLARRGLRVALLEATRLEGDRYGETLPPEINPALRELGLWDAFSALDSVQAPGIVSAWGASSPSVQDFVSNAHGAGWHIDRNRFDAMLCQEATIAGATVFLDCMAQPSRISGGGWWIGGVNAAFLVDASGHTGLRIDEDHAYQKDDTLLAIAVRLRGVQSSDLRTIIETTPQGWWYTAPIPNGQTIAMFFTDPAIYAEQGIVVGEQLEHAPLTAHRLQSTTILSSRVLHVPSACRRKIFGEGWAAVGDSASAYDPLSGRGIFKAFRHGVAAAEAITSGRMDEYAARVQHEFEEYVRQRRMHYASEQRWKESIFWRKRNGARGREGKNLL